MASPTWWASTSAASLSLTVSIRSTICDTGGPSTSASGVAAPAARRRTGWPVTRTPAARSSWAKYVAAVSDGSGTRPLPEAGRPSSAHSAVMRETTPSGT